MKRLGIFADQHSRGDCGTPTYNIGRYIWERVVPEMWSAITDRIIPQGAAELSNALFTGRAYSPYGPALRPLKRLPEAAGPKAEVSNQPTPVVGVVTLTPTKPTPAVDVLTLTPTAEQPMPDGKIGLSIGEVLKQGLEELQKPVFEPMPQDVAPPTQPIIEPDR